MVNNMNSASRQIHSLEEVQMWQKTGALACANWHLNTANGAFCVCVCVKMCGCSYLCHFHFSIFVSERNGNKAMDKIIQLSIETSIL